MSSNCLRKMTKLPTYFSFIPNVAQTSVHHALAKWQAVYYRGQFAICSQQMCFFKSIFDLTTKIAAIAEHFYAVLLSFLARTYNSGNPKIATDKDYRACDSYLMSRESRRSRVATFMRRGLSCGITPN